MGEKMKHYQVMLELLIDFDAENQQVADYAIQNIEVEPKFPRFTNAKLVNSEEEWGEICEVEHSNRDKLIQDLQE